MFGNNNDGKYAGRGYAGKMEDPGRHDPTTREERRAARNARVKRRRAVAGQPKEQPKEPANSSVKLHPP